MTQRATIPDAYRERLNKLAVLFANTRSMRRMSLRDVADESGVAFTILNRFEHGQPLDLPGLLRVLTWLHLPLSWLSGDGDGIAEAYRRGWDDCAKAVRAVTATPLRNESGCLCGCPVVDDMCSCPEGCPCEPDCGFCLAPNSAREPERDMPADGAQ